MSEIEDYKVLNVSENAFNDFQAIMTRPELKRISDLQNKHLFMLALVLGYKHKKNPNISRKHSGGYCRVETLSEEDKALIKAIAITESKDINILSSIKEQYLIAEKFANGGIVILKEIVNEPGDFFVNLSKEL